MSSRQQKCNLRVGEIYRGAVSRIESFGAFVNIETDSAHYERGLVHISQLARDRVEKVSDVVEENEQVYVKVLSIDTGDDGRYKVSLSMKYCGQGDGSDRDPNMIQYEESQRQRTRGFEEPKPLELGAIYNTRCTKCGGSGHIASECYNTGDTKYDLIPEAPEERSSISEPPRGHPVGRGRGAVLPAWMSNSDTNLGPGIITTSKNKGSKKRKAEDRHDSDRKSKKEKKEKKAKKEKKEKKEKESRKASKRDHKRDRDDIKKYLRSDR